MFFAPKAKLRAEGFVLIFLCVLFFCFFVFFKYGLMGRLFPRVREFGENVRQFIPRLHFFFFF